MNVIRLQDQLLIVEKIISKALNLWFGASLYMLEFIKEKKKKKKSVLGSSTRNLYSLIKKKYKKWKKVVQMTNLD